MNKQIDFQSTDQHIVYVKAVATADLPLEVQEQADGIETLYSVHDADGEQIALVADPRMAQELARQHDKAAVSVH